MVAMLGTFRLGEVGGLVGVRFVLLVGDCGVFLNRFRGSARWGSAAAVGLPDLIDAKGFITLEMGMGSYAGGRNASEYLFLGVVLCGRSAS